MALPVVIREAFRARARAVLTIAGITIGIYTLFVLGSIAEHFRASVDAAKDYVSGSVRLVTKTDASGQNPGIPPELLERIRELEGVAAVTSELTLLFDGFDLQSDPLTFLMPKALVDGVDPELAPLVHRGFEVVDGRWLERADGLPDDGLDRVRLPHGPGAMVSKKIARKRGYRVGEPVTIRRESYTLVGIYTTPEVPMGLLPDGIVPIERLRQRFEAPSADAARAFLEEAGVQVDPATMTMATLAQRLIRDQRDRYLLWVVVIDEPDRATATAARIEAIAPGVAVISPERLAEEIERAGQMFIVITFVISIIASIVGGLLIVNTMAMSVLERRREIGIRIACGASSGQIAREVLIEAGTLGAIGAALGLLGGLATVAALNPWVASQLETGDTIFRPTLRLGLIVVVYGVGLGAAAGLYPAWRAARTDPVETLRAL